MISVGIISYAGDIVAERIEPYIYDMLLVKGNGDAPCEGCSGYTQILKSGLEEVVDHLILT